MKKAETPEAVHFAVLDIIEEMADDLYTGCIISEYDRCITPEKRRWLEKYCRFNWPKSDSL